MRIRTGIALIALVAVAGCGGKKPAASATSDSSDTGVKYAQCMRQHGIDMPDPKPGSGVQIGTKKGDEGKVKAAMQACRKYAPKAMNNADDPKERDKMLKLAQCMRQHGINMPDPQPGKGLTLDARNNADKSKVEAAMKACGGPGPGPR